MINNDHDHNSEAAKKKNAVNKKRDKYPKAREALRLLINAILPLYKATDQTQSKDPYLDILKDVPTRTGEPADQKTLSGIYNGRSPNFIKVIAQNISRLLQERKFTDVAYQQLLWTIFEEVDPDYCPPFTAEYVRYRISKSKTVHISNNFLPFLKSYADLLKDVDDLKIVLMSPSSTHLNDRANQIGDKVQIIHNEIASDLSLLEEKGVPIECVKQNYDMPRNPFYIFDNDIFCGFYLSGKLAIDSPFRKFDAGKEDGKKLSQEFENIWIKAKPASYDVRTPIAVHKDVQMLSTLFPSLVHAASGKVVRELGDQIEGVYRFARFRRTYYRDPNVNMPIITGLMQFFPFTQDGGLRWEAVLPDPHITDFSKLPRVKGRIIPSKSNIFLIGETSGEAIEDKHPTLAGTKKFVRTDENWKYLTFQGILLRQHTDEDIYTSRVIFKAENCPNLWDAQELIGRENVYMNKQQFGKVFNMPWENLRLNKKQEDDRGMMRVDKFLTIDPDGI